VAGGTSEQLEDSEARTRRGKLRPLVACAATAAAGLLHGTTSCAGLGELWVSRRC
jgi:hypothetical protein